MEIHITSEDQRMYLSKHVNNFIANKFVEKGKISYFGLARNLIRHLISPNQDDLSYSSRTFISSHQILLAAKHSLFGWRRRPVQTSHWPFFNSDAF